LALCGPVPVGAVTDGKGVAGGKGV
jgi:hypothetical protein